MSPKRGTHDRDFVVELAKTTNELFAKAVTDPHAAEIAEQKFSGHTLVGEIVDAVVKRLHQVKIVLEEDYELPVCLLNATYYTRFRDDPPKTRADARRCVAGIGHAARAVGIHLQTGDGDLVWRAAQEQGLASGAGQMRKSADRILSAVQQSRLSEATAGELLTAGRQRAQPTLLELDQQVTKALPGVE